MTIFETATLIVNVAYTTATIVLVIIAYLQLKNLRHENASRAALEFTREEASSEWTNVRKKFNNAVRSGKFQDPKKLVRLRSSGFSEDIRAVLNRYEVIALGIKTGAISEDFIKRFWRNTVISDWGYVKDYVSALRTSTGNTNLYLEFEWLRNRWIEK